VILLVLAQSAPEAAAPWLTLINLGVAGIFLWAFITGKVHSDKEHQRLITENTRLVAENDELQGELRRIAKDDREVLVPTLVRATDVLTQYLERRSSSGNTPPPLNKPIGR
jgi:hypothetical protein